MKNGKPKPRVVLDTNVLLSALVFGGKPRRVTNLVSRGDLVLVSCEEAMTELRRVVAAKFPDFHQEAAQLEKLLEVYAEWVKLGAIDVTICADPDDNKFIEIALIGECSHIISGDRHLLKIGVHQGVEIVSPAGFLAIKI